MIPCLLFQMVLLLLYNDLLRNDDLLQVCAGDSMCRHDVFTNNTKHQHEPSTCILTVRCCSFNFVSRYERLPVHPSSLSRSLSVHPSVKVPIPIPGGLGSQWGLSILLHLIWSQGSRKVAKGDRHSSLLFTVFVRDRTVNAGAVQNLSQHLKHSSRLARGSN